MTLLKGRGAEAPRTVMARMEPGVRSNCCDENIFVKILLE